MVIKRERIAPDYSGATPASVGAQPVDADLTTIAGLTATTDNIMQAKSSAWASRTPAQVASDLVTPLSASLQPLDADLTTIAALDSTTAGALATDGSGWIRKTYAQLKTALSLTSSDVGLGSVTNDAQVVKLTLTAVKTSNYTAAANEFVPVDTTSGNVTVTFPTAPADGTRVGIKHVVRGSTNTITVALGGSDVFNVAGGATSGTITLLNQATIFQYKSSGAIWYATGDDMPLSQLDLRFQPLDSDLTAIAALTATTDNIVQSVGSAWASRTPTQVKAALALNNVDNTSDANAAVSTATQTALDAKLAALPTAAVTPKSGYYFYPVSGSANGTSAGLGIGTARAIPWVCETAVTLSRIAVEVTTAGEAGAKVRLGIYSDSGSYYPGSLVVDAGQVAADAAAVVEATISTSLTRGIYWLVVCVQNVTTTQPTMRTLTGWAPPIPIPLSTSAPSANGSPQTHYNITGVTAAFPGTFTAGGSVGSTTARVILKAA